MDATQLGLFVAATLLLNITPGPDMLYTIANGVQRGPLAAAVSAFGIGLGAVFHAGMASLGVAALIAASDMAFDILRIAGAAYLIWIGVKSFWSRSAVDPSAPLKDISYSRLFLRGLLTNILNPKVILFFVALLPQFVDPLAENISLWLFAMGCFVGLSGTVINSLVGIIAGGAGKLFMQNPKFQKWIDRVTGSLFISLGIRLFLVERN